MFAAKQRAGPKKQASRFPPALYARHAILLTAKQQGERFLLPHFALGSGQGYEKVSESTVYVAENPYPSMLALQSLRRISAPTATERSTPTPLPLRSPRYVAQTDAPWVTLP